jgi:hypothetical protein
MKSSYIASINEDSDGALVTAAKCADSQAFEQLFLRHKQRALSVAQRITNNHHSLYGVPRLLPPRLSFSPNWVQSHGVRVKAPAV